MTESRDLWIVVPGYNERDWIAATIAALAAQEGARFTVLFVDNASDDGTAVVARAAADAHPQLDLRIIDEAQKGTGAAADTGVRHAIDEGARFVLRTDADCVPRPDWAARMRRALEADGLDLVGGNLRHRSDDGTAPRGAVILFPLLYGLVRIVGRVRPDNNRRDEGYQAPFVLAPGCNMGVRADAYLASGGFPRTSIEDVHEDKELTNRVRRVSSRVGYRRRAIVEFSNRRVAKHGIRQVLRWYLDHGAGSEVIDVR